MAPLRKVGTLYSLCTDKLISLLSSVFWVYDQGFEFFWPEMDLNLKTQVELYKFKSFGSSNDLHKDLKELRHYLVENLNHSIRQDLLDLAARSSISFGSSLSKSFVTMSIFLDFLLTLLDSRIVRVDPAGCKESNILNVSQCRRLIKILIDSKVTSLQEIVIQLHFQTAHAKRNSSPMLTNSFFNFARTGLGASLTKLTLHSICDNKTLDLLGKRAVNLTYLDISKSWSVTDYGICKLLSNDCACALRTSGSIRIHNKDEALKKIWHQISTCDFKPYPCTSSLREVRIQDTDTTVVAVGLLLRFVKNLQSLGGFIYNRNVGDVIWTFTKLSQGKERLKLSCLYDSHMPQSKAVALSSALPNLSNLYTRGMWLPYLVVFPKLSTLTADFDQRDCTDQLKNFFSARPCFLKHLIILDETSPLQLSLLAENCIHLEELQCAVAGSWKPSEHRPFFPNLLTCRIFTKHRETIHPFLAYNNSLREFQVCIDDDVTTSTAIDDSTIWDALECRTSPPRLETVVFSAKQTVCDLSYSSVWTLARTCPDLRRIGDLKMWQVWPSWTLPQKISSKNLDLDVSVTAKPHFWSHP